MEILQKYINNGFYDCDVNISAQEWEEILMDSELANFETKSWLIRFYLADEHKTTCRQLGKKYNCSAQTPNSLMTHFAKRVQSKLNRFQIIDSDNKELFWLIPFIGRDTKGGFEWQLRPQLVEAMENLELTDLKVLLVSRYKYLLKNNQDIAFDNEKYKWELIENCKGKSIDEIVTLITRTNLIHTALAGPSLKFLLEKHNEEFKNAVEDLSDENIQISNRLPQFKKVIADLFSGTDLKYFPNDERVVATLLTCLNPNSYSFYKDSVYQNIVSYFGYEKRSPGRKLEHYLEIVNEFIDLVSNDSYIQEFEDAHLNGLSKYPLLTVQNLMWVCVPEKNSSSIIENIKPITNNMANTNIQTYIDFLKENKNIILHGAPGTGKTFLAKQIAEAMNAEYKLVQFHQSYDYTDFVEGLRPKKSEDGKIGFELVDGVFKMFCEEANRNFKDSLKSKAQINKEIETENKIQSFISEAYENVFKFTTKSDTPFTICGYPKIRKTKFYQ